MAQFAVDLPRVEDRNNPSAEFIRSLRRRYPVEREIDRVLTRKMERRAISRYSPVSLSDLEEGARKLIGARYGGRFQLSNSRWLTGGASKLQVVFDLEWRGLEVGETRVTRMVLRVEPPESVVETSRNREFEVIRAVGNLVPVPPCYWIDDDATFLPYPALIYGFAAGSAKPSKVSSEQITGIGLNYGPELRPKLGLQFLEGMGRFHNVDQATIDKIGKQLFLSAWKSSKNKRKDATFIAEAITRPEKAAGSDKQLLKRLQTYLPSGMSFSLSGDLPNEKSKPVARSAGGKFTKKAS